MSYDIASESEPAHGAEIDFPAPMNRISRAQFVQWAEARVNDPETDDIGRMLLGLFSQLPRAEAAEQACVRLERQVGEALQGIEFLKARVELLEADPRLVPFDNGTLEIAPERTVGRNLNVVG